MKLANQNSSVTALRWMALVLVASFLNLASADNTGIYIGTYSTSGDNGIIAVFVGSDGNGAFIHIDQNQSHVVSSGSGGGYVEGFPVANNSFSFTEGDSSVSGTFSGSSLSGTVTSTEHNITFSATAVSTTGTYSSAAGLYDGTVVDISNNTDNAAAIIAPNGNVYAAVDDFSGNSLDGFTGSLSGGNFNVTSALGVSVSGSLDSSSGSEGLIGTWNGGGDSGTFSLYLSDTLAPQTPWPDATSLGNGKMDSTWFGVFNETYYPWIYHQQHGWMYVFGTDPTSIWLYNQTGNMGFLWTGSGVYPWLWSDSKQTWLYYEVGSSSPRWFYNWNTSTWEKH